MIAEPKNVWDLGANSGLFSRIAAKRSIPTVAFDIDPVAVEVNYKETCKSKDRFMLPLVMDLTNPSPSLGWHSSERDSLIDRGPADMVFALALIHHLAISNNLPFSHIAKFFAEVSNWLIIEFVPKSDSQVQRLLQTREDIFGDYNKESFESAFSINFEIKEIEHISNSVRTLYLMKRRQSEK